MTPVSADKFLKKTFVALLTLVFAGLMACQRAPSPQESCQFLQNPDRQRISWNNEVPVPLYIHSSVPREAYPALEEAMTIYQNAMGRKMFEIVGYGTSGPASPSRDGYSVIYWMNNWEPERLQEQGRTTVYWSGNAIYEADMRINGSMESHLTFHMSQNQPVHGVDLTSLIVHELGHVLGLEHNHLAGSIMNTHLQEGTNRTVLSAEDLGNLACEYNSAG